MTGRVVEQEEEKGGGVYLNTHYSYRIFQVHGQSPQLNLRGKDGAKGV